MSILDFIRFADDRKCHRTISLCDEQTGEKYTDLLELQILELKKLPGDLREDDEVIQWMRFLAGKDRKELEDMASTSEYIEVAYRELERMSADERARLEYEARQKAIRDHDAIMSSAWETGMEKGMEKGLQKGREAGPAVYSPPDAGGRHQPGRDHAPHGATEEEVEKARNM